MMETNNKCQVGIVRGKEWRQHCDMLPGTLEKRVSNINSFADTATTILIPTPKICKFDWPSI